MLAQIRSRPTTSFIVRLCHRRANPIVCRSFSSDDINGDAAVKKKKNASGTTFNRIAMIGAGKMAQAFMEPMISKGVQPADKFFVYDVSIQALNDTRDHLGIQTTDTMPEAIEGADLVILAVKPQNLTDAFYSEIQKGKPSKDAIALSIIAGKTMSDFLNTGMTKIVRSMPNTPAMIGQGMTVWSCTPNVTTEERRKIRDVLSSCGQSVRCRRGCVFVCLWDSQILQQKNDC